MGSDIRPGPGRVGQPASSGGRRGRMPLLGGRPLGILVAYGDRNRITGCETICNSFIDLTMDTLQPHPPGGEYPSPPSGGDILRLLSFTGHQSSAIHPSPPPNSMPFGIWGRPGGGRGFILERNFTIICSGRPACASLSWTDSPGYRRYRCTTQWRVPAASQAA
jgi:hypothetical protein